MQTRHGTMATDRPERYAKQLAGHWARKGSSGEEDGATVIRFETGQVVRMRPDAGLLRVEASVPDGADALREHEPEDRADHRRHEEEHLFTDLAADLAGGIRRGQLREWSPLRGGGADLLFELRTVDFEDGFALGETERDDLSPEEEQAHRQPR